MPFASYGSCQVTTCPNMASTPLGLCPGPETRYRYPDRPGGGNPARYAAVGLQVEEGDG